MGINIALAGNPNSGKTTLFNALTGSNQFVGNWPGVTVEKKEGRLRSNPKVTVTDLPGIYSLSPYTLEEVVARDFLVDERPDAILNVIDGSNLERNLYLSTQLLELGIPMVIAINMMDMIRKNGDDINIGELGRRLGCAVVEISALKSEGLENAVKTVCDAAGKGGFRPKHNFSGVVEHALAHIEEAAIHHLPQEEQRWYAVKIFERDEKVLKKLALDATQLSHIESDIAAAEAETDDDAESIITNERYDYIMRTLKDVYKKRNAGKLTISDKIDKVVTNRIAALPIFAVIMFLVYFISVSTVGAIATDWMGNGVFGEGWHLFGIGSAAYGEDADNYEVLMLKAAAFKDAAAMQKTDPANAVSLTAAAYAYDDKGNITDEFTVTHSDYLTSLTAVSPSPAAYGVWIPGIPAIADSLLSRVSAAPWLSDLLINGIIAGVGAVLGFVPQMLILFLFLAFLESCGYMSRIAFILDRLFRKFGLSGKSFIPILIGTGCGVPGIMASRAIESDRDRKMTVMTTTFIPCGAKLPVIALIAGAMFGGAWWVASSAYFLGIFAIVVSGIMLKKTRPFYGNPAPFVMELPAYHWPTVSGVLRSMWERGWSFIKKAGTVILLATIIIWFASNYGFRDGTFGMVSADNSLLAIIGSGIAWLFAPLGWGNWQAAVATITGLLAKESVVGTLGVLLGHLGEASESGWQFWDSMRTLFSPLSAYSFMVFNLLCAPCFAAMGAIRREMGSGAWTFFAIGYQCVFAYAIALIVFQAGSLFTGGASIAGLTAAFAAAALILRMISRPMPKRRLEGRI